MTQFFRRQLCLWLAFCGLSYLLLAQDTASGASPYALYSPYRTEIQLDWDSGRIDATIAMNLQAAGLRLPSGRAQAENSVESRMMHLVRPSILAISFDSYRTIEDCIADGTIDPDEVESFIAGGHKRGSRLSADFQELIISYQFSLHQLAALFVKHSTPMEQARVRDFTPTRSYTGILIYVQGLYPVHGEQTQDYLRPSLFPRVYDQNMTLLLERNLIRPQALRGWGTVGWAAHLDSPLIEARIGQDPLRIMAAGIFGTRRSDVLLSAADAARILSHPDNRQLISEGRVVLVYGR